MGEKGNVVDTGAVATGGATLVDRAGGVASATVVQTGETLKGKVIASVVDHTIEGATDRLRERRTETPTDPAPPDGAR
jgi:hypothetical protein